MTRARVLLAFVALCVLAGVSFGASFLHLGAFGVPFALAIASLKVAVVAAIFMELTHTRHSIAFTGATALAFITLLTGLVVTERETRVDDVAAAPDRARVDAAAAAVTEREARTDDVSAAAPALTARRRVSAADATVTGSPSALRRASTARMIEAAPPSAPPRSRSSRSSRAMP